MSKIDFSKLAAPFPAEAISWRAQTVSKDGSKALALAYIDSRDVQHRLDEVCGPDRWQSEHFDCGQGRLGCKIGILTESGWVWKSDGAGATDVEAEKGAFSDALKRAAVSWGIGRYLYDLGNTWVPCESADYNGKKKFSKFTDNPWKYVKGAAGFLPDGPEATATEPPVAPPAKKPTKPIIDIAEPRALALLKQRGVPQIKGNKAGWEMDTQWEVFDLSLCVETKPTDYA